MQHARHSRAKLLRSRTCVAARQAIQTNHHQARGNSIVTAHENASDSSRKAKMKPGNPAVEGSAFYESTHNLPCVVFQFKLLAGLPCHRSRRISFPETLDTQIHCCVGNGMQTSTVKTQFPQTTVTRRCKMRYVFAGKVLCEPSSQACALGPFQYLFRSPWFTWRKGKADTALVNNMQFLHRYSCASP